MNNNHDILTQLDRFYDQCSELNNISDHMEYFIEKIEEFKIHPDIDFIKTLDHLKTFCDNVSSNIEHTKNSVVIATNTNDIIIHEFNLFE